MFLQIFIEQVINGLISGAMYALMALGFSLLWGILGIFNFAHGALYALGGYITFYLITSIGFHPYTAIVMAMVSMFFFGMFMERIFIRFFKPLREDPYAYITATVIMTIGLSILIETGLLLTFGGRFKTLDPFVPGVFSFGEYQLSKQLVFIFCLSCGFISGAVLFIKYSKIGLAMNGIAQDPIAAQLMGVNNDIVFCITFGVSALLAGLAGALLAPVYSLSPTVGWMPFTYAFLVVVVGGLGNISGVIVTAFLMGLIKNIFAIWISPAWVLPIIFGIMILILLARPRGLFGTRE